MGVASRQENVDRQGNLPELGPFAVVNRTTQVQTPLQAPGQIETAGCRDR
jgi:hypothetical protein